MGYRKVSATLLISFFFTMPVFAQMTGSNAPAIKDYLPPDLYIPHGRVIKLKKLDINTANLQQLMALPEVNEDTALKIMQERPIESLNDLEKLPYIPIDRMETIIKGFSHLVIQEYNNDEDLKQ